MHLIVPFAAALSEAGRDAARSLALPHLQALVSLMAEAGRDEASEWSLSPPHERALARALGLSGADGCLPWAARAAAADGIEVDDLAWGQVTPVHWHLGTEQVSLVDPSTLQLDEDTARALFEAVRPLFVEEGFAFAWGAPQRWYVAHESLSGLPTASLDRVVGRNVDRWLGSDRAARRIRRLQAEVQMLLHAHPANAAREARGLLPVNSVWISGCGPAQRRAAPVPDAVVDERLRGPALAEDWAAWVKAWDTLDAGPLRALREAVQAGRAATLVLCGERAGLTLRAEGAGLWQRLRATLAPRPWQPLLEGL